MNNAYSIERRRQTLAKKGQIKDLRTLYAKNLPEIQDLNTPTFWNIKYNFGNSLAFQDLMTRDRIRIASSFVPKDAKIKVLDIGAGLGWIEEELIKFSNIEIYGNDFSKNSVSYLKRNFRGEYSVQSIYNLIYSKSYFDVIIILEVLEHIPPSKILTVLKSVNSLLKAGGILVVSVPMNEGLETMSDNPNGHVRMYTEELIKTELEISDFSIVKAKKIYAFNRHYKIKTKIAKLIKTHNPNNIVLQAVKI